ncbi:putative homocysteine S-methyltransferase family protein (plasmid) [Deinococcus proteolyticus MRP]|uniref:Putative homocysteine S-methyltransferase family protein n=1 Tax=Deinococcus proteolyticus (strain ATCC 35074 / DSM 20540 / JCM 6276 / NBRC 101906 / NCIMB 13154 / VKM Ac-1939 / CCM 2703 / MRP) TaxID=693977 RepID=F0RPW8_DEIPM|nr:putative homocysteine S-methyltransferase family protein [Deinococcus proteolyticus MRP]
MPSKSVVEALSDPIYSACSPDLLGMFATDMPSKSVVEALSDPIYSACSPDLLGMFD